MTRREQRLQSEVGTFMRQYGRRGGYDRDVEREVKRLDPWELDELLNGADDEIEDELLEAFEFEESEA